MSLPAVILVGGQGTRLRPLTETIRKDMLPLVDRPLLAYTLEHLRRHGVTPRGDLVRIPADADRGALRRRLRRSGARIPSRGRAARHGRRHRLRGTRASTATFLALNGDSLREADLGALIDFHRASGGKATIMLTPVADPSRYGLVRLAADGRVRQFLEKPRPEEIDTNLINAGLYVLEPDVLDLIPEGRPVSIERDVFPRLCEEGSVFGLAQPGYWLDVGTPASYLQAHRDVLERTFRTELGEALGQRLHTRRPDRRGAPRRSARAPGLRRARCGARGRAFGRAASRSWGPAPAWVQGRWSRTRSIAAGATIGDGVDRDRLDRRCGRPASARDARSQAWPWSAPQPRSARATDLDHGLRVGAGRLHPGGGTALLMSRYRHEPRHIDKPWGWELIWAEAEDYVGKLLFVRAGHSLSLQYHERKDESWLVQEGRATLELGEARRAAGDDRDRRRRRLPLPSRDRASRHRARGHARGRGVDAPPRRRRAPRGPLRAGRTPH